MEIIKNLILQGNLIRLQELLKEKAEPAKK